MGGEFGPEQPLDPEINSLVLSQKSQIEAKLGAHFNIFVPISYQAQAVAGMNYNVKIAVDNGRSIFVTIFEDLPCNGGEVSITEANFS